MGAGYKARGRSPWGPSPIILMLGQDGMPFPERMSALNQEHVESIDEGDPARLADLLEGEVTGLLALLGDDEARPVPFFGTRHTVGGLSGVLLGELLLHGLDLARTLDRPWLVDAHVSAEPVTYLLLGYGRTSRWRALLSGRVRAWGRRPWLAGRFGSLFAET